jgi:SRSO17 transposase
VFHHVRHCEQYTQLERGLLAETKRTSLPRLAQAVHGDQQAFHHVLTNAEWSVDELRAMRLQLTAQALAGRPCVLGLDATGDRKPGHTTDSTASQSLGGRHQVAQGIVSVSASGVLDHVAFPLALSV